MKVLIVQELPFLATALKLTLLKKGYDLVISKDAHQFESVFEKVTPVILIADISKGKNMNCILEAKKKNIPVIVLCENEEAAVLQQAFDCGADDYLFKPASLSELALRVNILSMHKSHAVA